MPKLLLNAKPNAHTKTKPRIKLTLRTRYDSIETHQNDEFMIPTSIAYTQASYKRVLMIDQLHSMRKQENSHYICNDYMEKEKTRPTAITKKVVDESCRQRICEWCYRVTDFFNFDRETVYFAMSCLDRFMAEKPTDRSTYKLAATTALLMAIKIHQPNKVNLNNVVSELSRGQFDADDVANMEFVMLRCLSWRVHPPTPKEFVLRLLALNPFTSTGIQEFDVEGLKVLAIFFVELSVWDYFFVTERQSTVALAAILNAMEGLGLFQSLQRSNTNSQKDASSSTVIKFVETMFDTMGVDPDSMAISEGRNRLWDLYKQSEEFANKRKVERTRRLDRTEGFASIHRSPIQAKGRTGDVDMDSPKSVI